MPRGATRRRLPCINGRWRSARRCWGQSIPTWRGASTTWQGSTTQGRYEEAAPLYQRALAIREEVLGAKHPDMVVVLENYAALLQATGCSQEAENFKARAQTIRASHI